MKSNLSRSQLRGSRARLILRLISRSLRARTSAFSIVVLYKYLARLLEAFGLKAVIVRPGLEGWNAISYTMTLEQMLESIGEPV